MVRYDSLTDFAKGFTIKAYDKVKILYDLRSDKRSMHHDNR
jgi:hypothetical protein